MSRAFLFLAVMTALACGEAPTLWVVMPSGSKGPGPTTGSEPTPATPNPPAPTTDLFYKTFGSPQNPPVIFLHGGPGANGYAYEVGPADALAQRGYYVITYDRRGCGRSPKGTTVDYSYQK